MPIRQLRTVGNAATVLLLLAGWAGGMGILSAVFGTRSATAAAALDSPDKPADAEEAADYQDLIVLGESRPLMIRLHIETDGRGFRTAWTEYVESLADYLDENDDGTLSVEELERAPWQRLLREPGRSMTLADLLPWLVRNPKNNSVTVAEWIEFVGEFGGTFEMASAMGGAMEESSALVGDPLFDRLDQNEDGKLARGELEAAPRVLRKLDLNDDHAIASEELSPQQRPGEREEERTDAPLSYHHYVLLTEPMRTSADVARQLIERYDGHSFESPADQKLGPEECRFNPDQFVDFDANHDGGLGVEELVRMLVTREPDLELILRLGKRRSGKSRMEVAWDRTATAPGTRGPERIADNNWVLWLDGMKLDLRVLGGTVRPDAVVRFYQSHFFASDTNQNGYLEPDEARQSRIYGDVFERMDADGNEKLYPQEILDYLRHRTEVTLRRTELTVDTYGGTLFETADSDRDGRLGTRELREAAERMNVWDQDGDGQLAPSEYPRELHLTIGQGRGELPGGVVVQAPEAGVPRNQRPVVNAPTWFEKMDRNRDGDLSAREFLGSTQVFERLDADQDGLVDPEEAARADSPE